MELLRRLRPHLTYANVMVTLLAFIVLGGVAYAVAEIDSGDVKNDSLKSKDVRNQNLTGNDVAPDSLGGDDIDETTLQVPNMGSGGGGGPATPNGPAGGDLAGNYPNPNIKPDAVDSGKVVDDSLNGDDVDETSLDDSILQRRVTGTCAGSDAIQAVDASGVVTCTASAGDSTMVFGGSLTTNVMAGLVTLYSPVGRSDTGEGFSLVAPVAMESVGVPVPRAGVARNLFASVSATNPPLLGTSYTIQIVFSAGTGYPSTVPSFPTPTTLSCTAALPPAIVNAVATCKNDAIPVPLNAGDRIAVAVSTDAAAAPVPPPNVTFGFEYK